MVFYILREFLMSPFILNNSVETELTSERETY